MANEAFHLEWHGPFAIVDDASDPNLFTEEPESSRLPGVYAWTIPVGDDYWLLLKVAQGSLRGESSTGRIVADGEIGFAATSIRDRV